MMLVDDFSYYEQRAGTERLVAEATRNRYVKACHCRLAERYERQVASFMSLPADWPLDRLDPRERS